MTGLLASSRKQQRMEQVRRWVAIRLGETGYERPATWGTSTLIRFLLTLTYEGSVELFIQFNGKPLNLGCLELAVRSIVPGVRIGWSRDSLLFKLPGVEAERPRLLLVDEAMLVTREGPWSRDMCTRHDHFARTLACIWLTTIDATDPFHE